MKIDFKQVITNLAGEPILEPHVDSEGKESKVELELGVICNRAVLAVDEKEKDGDEKMRRWNIAQAIYANKSISVEDIALVKTMVGKYFGPSIVGPVWTMLDEFEKGEKDD